MDRIHRGVCICALLLMVITLAPSALRGQENFTVAILVVDDFGGVDLETVEAPEGEESCAVSLEGQSYFTRGASAGEPISEPHGELVYAQLEEMFVELEAEEFIQLVKVDILGLSTEMVAAKIEEAMQEVSADFYVANMSFAIIPCEFVADFADFDQQLRGAARNQSQYRGIFQRAVAFYDQTVFPVNSSHFQEETGLDPLQDFFTANAETVVPIASAGNFGLDYPFWPGAWGQVVSVSGSTGEGFQSTEPWDKRDNSPLLGFDTEETGRRGTRISNFGEIMLPGQYASEFGDVVGTSFAAPRMSVIVALYLSAVGSDFCRKDNGSIALDHGDWSNLTLEEAAEAYCPDLLAYLPG